MRLSALGDVTHVTAVVQAIQRALRNVQITWVIGSVEAKLLAGMKGIEFVHVDKSASWHSYRTLRKQLRHRRFDVLLQMQVSLRAGLLSTCVRAPRKIGFERGRSREMHSLFINERLTPHPERRHVVDVMLGFAEHLGVTVDAPSWSIPIPDEALAFAKRHISGPSNALVISPCSSHALRDWHAAGYAAVADHAWRRHQLEVVLVGGKTQREAEVGKAIEQASTAPIVNLIGKDTLPQLAALLARARVVVSPDSGPAHIANAMGTPVIGLYAPTDPERSGPYHSQAWCLNRYAEAAAYCGENGTPRWGTKFEVAGIMDLITQGDAIATLDRFMHETERV